MADASACDAKDAFRKALNKAALKCLESEKIDFPGNDFISALADGLIALKDGVVPNGKAQDVRIIKEEEAKNRIIGNAPNAPALSDAEMEALMGFVIAELREACEQSKWATHCSIPERANDMLPLLAYYVTQDENRVKNIFDAMLGAYSRDFFYEKAAAYPAVPKEAIGSLGVLAKLGIAMNASDLCITTFAAASFAFLSGNAGKKPYMEAIILTHAYFL
ncbi:MAG: hypothetical protein ABW189_08850 [Rickettsiales bacterium]